MYHRRISLCALQEQPSPEKLLQCHGDFYANEIEANRTSRINSSRDLNYAPHTRQWKWFSEQQGHSYP